MDLYAYQGFIIDLDNTLILSEPFHLQAYKEALWKLVGYCVTEADALDYHGKTTQDCAARIFAREHIDFPVQEVVDYRNARMLEIYQNSPYPGAVEFVRWMAPRVKIGIASNSRREFVEHALKLLGVRELLPVVVTVEDVAAHKPDPAILHEAARQMGLAPADCLVFEDSGVGLQAILRGGYHGVLVINPRNPLPAVIPEEIDTYTWPRLLRMAQEAFPC